MAKRFLILFCVIAMILPVLPARAAGWPDISGHWAERELTKIIEMGYISGYDDGTVRPQSCVTAAQEATVLGRVLRADIASAEGRPWYDGAISAARRLGYSEGVTDPNAPITRRVAMSMLADAFCLWDSDENTDCLSLFPDANVLRGTEREKIASLVRMGIIKGSGAGLNPDGKLTRAELAAMLCRTLSAVEIVSTDAYLYRTGGTVLFTCDTENPAVWGSKIDRAVFRSDKLDSVGVTGASVGTLVIAGSGDITLGSLSDTRLEIGPGTGSVTVNGTVGHLGVTGDGRRAYLRFGVTGVTVTGNGVSLELANRPERLNCTGDDMSLSLSRGAQLLELFGDRARVSSGGRVDKIRLKGLNCVLPDSVGELSDETDRGLRGVSASLTAPSVLRAGEELSVSARLAGSTKGSRASAVWTVNGEAVGREELVFAGDDIITLKTGLNYTWDLPETSDVVLTLSDGERTATARASVKTENYPLSTYFEAERERVLGLVSTVYEGDFTTKWAEEHDYTEFEKTAFVNLQGYASDTNYLLWVNRAYQRVNVFTKSADGWRLDRVYMACTGAPGRATPVGVWKTTFKEAGWFHWDYDVYPVVRFKGGGYAFHSILYKHNSTELYDGAMGYPASHGCVRMLHDDVQWIYDTIPNGTTVVIY